MQIRPIRTDEDHQVALREIEALWGAKSGSSDGDRLDVLLTLVDAYEVRHWPLEPLDPIDLLRTHMDETGRTQAELAQLIGSRSRASEVLRRKRALTVAMIHAISEAWHIPADALVRPYPLSTAA